MPQLIRCTIIGLEPGESLTATLNGVTVEFTTEAAQHDIPAVPVEPVTQVTNPDGNPASENP